MSPARIIDSFTFDMLSHPWVLLLGLVVFALLVAELLAKPFGTLSISTCETVRSLHAGPRVSWHKAPALFRAAGLMMLVVALAHPLDGFRLRKDTKNVIDIMFCVDVSGSMRALDFTSGGQRRDRLFVTKQAVREFIQARQGEGNEVYGTDRVGLILYAAYAWTQCPLTLDYGVFSRELENAYIDQYDQRKSGTAIGSALGLAVSRLRKSEAESKVIILLTDGLNNAGELDPITAAQFAKEYDMRIYTIGAGSTGDSGHTLSTILGPRLVIGRDDPIDEETLKKIAAVTEGQYFRATDTATLESAYARISEMEKTEIEVNDYYEYKDAFVPYALAGAIALAASVFSRRKWWEPIP